MTELRDLLHAAAPRPSRAVDVDALLDEASRRRPWRRVALWFGSMAVVFGVGAGSTAVLSPADQPASVDTTRGPRPAVVELDGAGGEVRFEAVSGSHDAGDASDESPGSTTTTTTAPPSGWDPNRPWPPEKDPSARHREGCHVVAGGSGVIAPAPPLTGGAGNDDMSADSCRYVARRAGGYWGAGTWTVSIHRGDEKIVYSYYLDSPACAADVIRPGDAVTVTVRTAGATAEGEVHAGPEVDCGYVP